MKLIFTFAALLLAAQLFAQSKTESEILALSKKRVHWLLEGRVDSLATIYDENSITVHGNGMIKGTKEHFDDIKNGRPVYKSIELKDATVRDFGSTAVLVGKGIFHISMNDQNMTYNMVYTEVYAKKNNQWKLIARQASSSQ